MFFCDPPCHNFGKCIGPGICKCRKGFYGDFCTVGRLQNIISHIQHLAGFQSNCYNIFKVIPRQKIVEKTLDKNLRSAKKMLEPAYDIKS